MVDAAVPPWLHPVAEALEHITAEQLSPQMPQPPVDARPAAVLIVFADGEAGPEILLTRRGSRMRNHAGQISFPGGGTDPSDADQIETALREASEEVGLDPADVTVIGTLPVLWLPPSNFAVTPVIGYWHTPRELTSTSEFEVAQVLHQPIDQLMDPANRYSVTHPSGWTGPAFDVGADVPVWGFTAGIVARVFEVVGWEQPWDRSDHRPLPGGVR